MNTNNYSKIKKFCEKHFEINCDKCKGLIIDKESYNYMKQLEYTKKENDK
jgi:hypothetical protein